jgi:hypothetical protein
MRDCVLKGFGGMGVLKKRLMRRCIQSLQELMAGATTYGTGIDVWALGCTLGESGGSGVVCKLGQA